MQRRQFIGGSAALVSAGALGAVPARNTRPLNLLILGGTRFIGLHMTELALARGHRVTFFNRGRTRTDRFPQVPRLTGDRNGSLEALVGQRFDAVIDNSGYTPRQVRDSARLLRDTVPHYLFVSTLSVYAGFASANDESSALATLADPTTEIVDGQTYGPLKALSERAAIEVYGESATTILRPGLIVGPDDNTDRFTYWPARAARGGVMIAPGKASDPIQVIDARDLAAFALQCLEQRITGTFNVVSESGRYSIGDLVGAAVAAARRQVRPDPMPEIRWIEASFLAERQVAPWADMPVWVPPSPESAGFATTSTTRARAAGLTIRPLETTVEDTLRWHLARPIAEQSALKAGISAEREQEVLSAWNARR